MAPQNPKIVKGLDRRPLLCHTGGMTLSERALSMISDCIANGITEPDDIVAWLIDDELNEVVVEAVRLVQGGHYNE